MRVSRISVDRYISLHSLDIDFGDASGPVCLTGSNGSGKTAILRLVNEALSQMGISSQYNGSKGRPNWIDEDSFEVEFAFEDSEVNQLNSDDKVYGQYYGNIDEILHGWDRRITVYRHPGGEAGIKANGLNQLSDGGLIVDWLKREFDRTSQLKHVFIDANRAYTTTPSRSWSRDEIERLSDSPTARLFSALSSIDSYHLWLEWLATNDFSKMTEARGRARRQDGPNSDYLREYEDPLTSLIDAVVELLPHLRISHIDSAKELIVETHGRLVGFSELSSGEREIIFLIGQILRMRTTKGIVLIDEPELHLNPEMVRAFTGSLQKLAGEAQSFFATHSYEVIEAVGLKSAYLLDRDDSGISTSRLLGSEPALGYLVPKLGRVGFSLASNIFVVIEGAENSVLEVPRFKSLVGHSTSVVFVPQGTTKTDVIEHFEEKKPMVKASRGAIRFKAIVDGDYDSVDHRSTSIKDDLLVLPMHEIENLYLHPPTLENVLAPILEVTPGVNLASVLLNSFDEQAGRWIWCRAHNRSNEVWKNLQDIGPLMGDVKKLGYQDLQDQWGSLVTSSKCSDSVKRELVSSRRSFERVRKSEDIWRHCHGKQALDAIAVACGWQDKGRKIEDLCHKFWRDYPESAPDELQSMLQFLLN